MKNSDIFWNSVFMTILILSVFGAIMAIGIIVFSDIVFIIFSLFFLIYFSISFLNLFKYFGKFVPNYLEKFNQYLDRQMMDFTDEIRLYKRIDELENTVQELKTAL